MSIQRQNLSVKIVANYQSDPLVVRDFWEGQYQANVEPASFGEIQQISPNWILDTMVQPQVVNFFETVERLPDVRLTGLRQEVSTTPIYYESESSLAYLRRRFSDTNVPVPLSFYDPGYKGLAQSAVIQIMKQRVPIRFINSRCRRRFLISST